MSQSTDSSFQQVMGPPGQDFGGSSRMSAGQFTGKNWFAWKKKILLVLRVKKLHKIVNGTEVEPLATSDKYEDWHYQNALAMGELCLNLADSELDSVRTYEKASEVWNCLVMKHEAPSVWRSMMLRDELVIKLPEGGNVSEHLSKFRNTLDAINGISKRPLEEYESAYALLRSLPASFHAMITTIDRVDEDKLTLRLVEDNLLQEELKRKALGQHATSSNTGNITTSAFFSASSLMSQNDQNNAAVPNIKSDRRNMTCSHCNRKGHDVKTCFQLHPHLKPASYKPKASSSEPKASGSAFAAPAATSHTNKDVWYVRHWCVTTYLFEA